MFEHLIYIVFSIFGLGFLVFIHEMGHFWMARREGMKVESFAIGFGSPVWSWVKNGVRWQIGWIPFGGYVKIAGMQKEGSREPHEIAEGFYSKSPMQRIRVALMGPAVNIAFALIAFAAIWISGGREKNFSEFTRRIGWVDPKSSLYRQGVRPGDVIQTYGGRPFEGAKDLLMASLMNDDQARIQGYKVDYLSGERLNFDYTLQTYPNPDIAQDKIQTIGVMSPARYLIFDSEGKDLAQILPPGSPLLNSGLQDGDRILWADGEMIFSMQQLSAAINDSTAFLTVRRGDEIFQTKVPRVHLDELKMTAVERAELDDWQHEAGLKGRVQDLYFIPYLLSPKGEVEARLDFLDEIDQTKAFQRCERCAYFNPLLEGDVVLAVQGEKIDSSYGLLQELQARKVLLIVQRDPSATDRISWAAADRDFDDNLDLKELNALISTIGTDHLRNETGHFALLNPIAPVPFAEMSLPQAEKTAMAQQLAQTQKELEAIQDPEQREQRLQAFEQSQRKLVLGVHSLKDRSVLYNPGPLELFSSAFKDTWRTLSSLVTGNLNPKFVAGPVGIVHIVQQSWLVGIKEALFWMAMISVNLGIINLIPIPVLDGGHILFSAIEGVTKKRLSSKTMERLVVPFVVLIIGLFVYITYQDIVRIISRFFS